ncbi:type II secretion system F family protein [Candidatus Nanohalobium constans]|uniref:Archaeal flagellar protein FlaJ n=1 Tax=Candidatus Nanohalobium constans TaxID=2565781 RepID=A0A5Q0UJK1_9ARCH|nr:type II secretion system F family protein [Candidatus Nanohalobium constans]QGA80999.1 archaeal flagellar protein FlaJ [Candidatus Nanohalobium constans]
MNLKGILLSLGQRTEKFFPQLERELRAARMDTTPSEYLSECVKKAFKLGFPSAVSLIAAGVITDVSSTIKIGVACFPILIFMGFITFAKYPAIKAKKRTRKLEKDLPYALRDILIEIKSGIPLYDAMKTVTDGYGEASEEFEIIVKDIDGGKSTIEALEESIVRNPSEQYRRAMWQINNSIKSGTDISVTLESVVDSIIQDQKLMIKKYGKELNPYVLVYLLLAVVGPSLGITGVIVISSFTGISVNQQLYIAVLFGLVVAQVFFLNLIKSKRPEVKA